jgi:hypothetical protein
VDVSVIVYVSRTTTSMPAFLADIFKQIDGISVEILAVDGGTSLVDFEKVGDYCNEHEVEFTIVRQEPMNRASAGYNVAAHMARGRTLVFINPDYALPPDFLEIASEIGSKNYVFLPRVWMNVVFNSTECQGLWSPPDGCTIIMSGSFFNKPGLSAAEWESTQWNKADAYIMASKLAADYPGRVGMGPVGGFEYRRWIASNLIPQYMPQIERNFVDVDEWVVDESDIRRFTHLGVPFSRVVQLIPPYVSMDDLPTKVSKVLEDVKQRKGSGCSVDSVVQTAQYELESALDSMMKSGELVLRPQLVVEAVEGEQSFRVRSTGNVALPFEQL